MLLALVTQLATRLLSSRSNSSYVVDSSDTTCTYICCYLLFQNPTTLFSSRSSSNYVVGFCSTTCNYVVFFSIKFKLYTLLTFVTQLATTVLFFFGHTGTIDAAWSTLKNYFPNSLSSQSRVLLLHAKSWQWRYINRSANLQQKTIEALKRIFWWFFSFRLHKNAPMKMSCYCGN